MKTKRLNFRLSEKADEYIRKKAEEANMSLTNYVLYSAIGKEIVNFDGVDEIIRQLKRIGNNLNQLVILSREGRIRTVNLAETQAELSKLHEQLAAALRR